mgnify:CR=1 FL=1
MAYTGTSAKQIEYAASVHPRLVARYEGLVAEWREGGCTAQEVAGAKRVLEAARDLSDARVILDLANVSSDDDNAVFLVALGYEEGPGLGIGKYAMVAAKSLLD